jgi:CRISPR-associated endoribonuclease Cas6
VAYEWRICLLEERWVGPALAGIQGGERVELNGAGLTITGVETQTVGYEALARQSGRWVAARPEARRHLKLEFLTPTVLYRHKLPMPLPDPVLVFHHYLCLWDSFAPRAWWVNINVLDAVEVHLALVEHRLESRPVRPGGKRLQTGFLGQVVYKMMAWEKLGADFLGTLHMLAQFGEFCGTGEGTEQGLGQTRYLNRRTRITGMGG